MIYNDDGLKILKNQYWDHIITDPDYVNQPPIQEYRNQCDGNIIIFCDARKRPVGPEPDEVLFWMKPISTKWSTKRCNRFVEEILVYRGKKSVFNPIHWSSMTGVFTDEFVSKPSHPYAKPIRMLEKLILMYTNEGQHVFDPFCGSGTTSVAAKMHRRKFSGCEINPEFYQMSCSRERNTVEYTNSLVDIFG